MVCGELECPWHTINKPLDSDFTGGLGAHGLEEQGRTQNVGSPTDSPCDLCTESYLKYRDTNSSFLSQLYLHCRVRLYVPSQAGNISSCVFGQDQAQLGLDGDLSELQQYI